MPKGRKYGGGSRKGRPNKSKDEARQLIDTVLKKYGGTKFIFNKLAELGAGIEMVETDAKDGSTRYYSKEPNPVALKTLAEYRFGKPPQEIQGDLSLTQKTLIIKDEDDK